jgi:hypothetical protein
LREYQTIAVSAYYSSCFNQALTAVYREVVGAISPEASQLLAQTINSSYKLEELQRGHLAFLRMSRQEGGLIDRNFLEIASEQLFHNELQELGSSRLATLHSTFLQEKGKSALSIAAKAAAKARQGGGYLKDSSGTGSNAPKTGSSAGQTGGRGNKGNKTAFVPKPSSEDSKDAKGKSSANIA